MAATMFGQTAVLQAVLAAGASANTPTADQQTTPLHLAAAMNKKEEVQVLLDHGKDVDIDARDATGATPLIYAAQFGRRSAIKVLLDNGANIYAVNDAGENAIAVASAHNKKKTAAMLWERVRGKVADSSAKKAAGKAEDAPEAEAVEAEAEAEL